MATAVALAIVYRLAAATFSRRIRTSAYDHAAGARSAARVSPDSPKELGRADYGTNIP